MAVFSFPRRQEQPSAPQDRPRTGRRGKILLLSLTTTLLVTLLSRAVPGVQCSPASPIIKRDQQPPLQNEELHKQQNPFLGFLSTIATTLIDTDLTAPMAILPDLTDWSCKVTEEHPYPVIILHGLFAPQFTSWVNMAKQLRAAGYCVYQMKYGMIPGIDFIGGMLDIKESAKELPGYIEKVLETSGAKRVDMVTHSEGGTVARWYLKYVAPKVAQEQQQEQQQDSLSPEPKVRSLVSVGPIGDGTLLQGITDVAKVFGLYDGISQWVMQFCVPCTQLLDKSEFMLELYKDGEILIPGVRMLNIVTRMDEFVTPYFKGAIQLVPEDEILSHLVHHLPSTATNSQSENEEEEETLPSQDLVQLQKELEKSHLPQGLQPGDIQNLFAEDYCHNNTRVSSHFGLFRSDFSINATLQFLSPTFTGTFETFPC
ncbi:triacylglycerol lipase [Entomortierella parvispora]|uniref:Triacylglycerol lipase n=1 Tax=Entomortierella parvispora TaxID=205924 RepID=A0A9P3LZ60_9FUNG|nr:triacylglycerol lipase [Entomortierella parvispora]